MLRNDLSRYRIPFSFFLSSRTAALWFSLILSTATSEIRITAKEPRAITIIASSLQDFPVRLQNGHQTKNIVLLVGLEKQTTKCYSDAKEKHIRFVGVRKHEFTYSYISTCSALLSHRVTREFASVVVSADTSNTELSPRRSGEIQ